MGDCLPTIDMGQKLGGFVVLLNTMWPRPRPTSVPSGILIHTAIWHNRHGRKIGGCAPFAGELGPHLTQCGLHNKWHPKPSNNLVIIHQRHRQHRQWSNSTGQTVLQTVAQKLLLSYVLVIVPVQLTLERLISKMTYVRQMGH